jgi:hypothetical protein
VHLRGDLLKLTRKAGGSAADTFDVKYLRHQYGASSLWKWGHELLVFLTIQRMKKALYIACYGIKAIYDTIDSST